MRQGHLKQIRAEFALTQAELATLLNCSRRTIIHLKIGLLRSLPLWTLCWSI